MTTEEKAIAFFEIYTHLTYDNTNNKHRVIISDITQYLDNTKDNTGLNSISLNGVSENYMGAFPSYILHAMDKLMKKVVFR